eukprot:1052211-Rhodomonas_salina.4
MTTTPTAVSEPWHRVHRPCAMLHPASPPPTPRPRQLLERAEREGRAGRGTWEAESADRACAALRAEAVRQAGAWRAPQHHCSPVPRPTPPPPHVRGLEPVALPGHHLVASWTVGAAGAPPAERPRGCRERGPRHQLRTRRGREQRVGAGGTEHAGVVAGVVCDHQDVAGAEYHS